MIHQTVSHTFWQSTVHLRICRTVWHKSGDLPDTIFTNFSGCAGQCPTFSYTPWLSTIHLSICWTLSGTMFDQSKHYIMIRRTVSHTFWQCTVHLRICWTVSGIFPQFYKLLRMCQTVSDIFPHSLTKYNLAQHLLDTVRHNVWPK